MAHLASKKRVERNTGETVNQSSWAAAVILRATNAHWITGISDRAEKERGFLSHELRGEVQHGDSQNNPVDRKGAKPAASNPRHEPCHASIGHKVGDRKTDRQYDPAMRVDAGHTDGIAVLASERLVQRIQRSHQHRRYGQ